MDLILKILAIIGFGPSKTGGGAQQGTEVTHLPPDLLVTKQSDYHYHRATYRRLLKFAFVQAGVILILIGCAGWIILTAQPEDRFFVATVDGRITRILPLDVPVAANNEMYSRVGTSVAAALTFGFLDYEQRRVEVGAPFDSDALAMLYKVFLGPSGQKEMIDNSYVYISNVEPSRPGGIVQQGVRDNIYEWVVSVPLLVTRKTGLSEEGQVVTRWNIQVLVQRAKSLEVLRGFTITAILGAAPEGQPQTVNSTVQGVKQ